jgi:hypothetical protein
VGRYGTVPGGQDRGENALFPRWRVGGVAHDATPHRDEHSLAEKRAPLLPGHTQCFELLSGEEAERRGGPFGDGPVNVVSCRQQ